LFFKKEKRFFLTGGAALAGFYLAHRHTKDLDLFTTQDIVPEGVLSLEAAARELGASLEAIQTSPDFRRLLVRRGSESVVVDLVCDRAPQMFAQKQLMGEILVDPPEEILANKLCSLLARAEIRDLVDVYELERKGYRIEGALPAAAQKDAGLTPAQLAWVLSQITLEEGATLPGEALVSDLRRYLDELIERLSELSYPGS
jgi:hypothetical protein